MDVDWMREMEVLDPNDGVLYNIFRQKSHAKALLSHGRFKRFPRGGAYDECCLKSCSVKEMMGYCADR